MRSVRPRLAFLVVVAVGVVAAGALRAEEVSGEYRVGPRDLIEIKVIEIPELNVERRVSDGGAINLPMVGDFPVTGLTAAEIRTSLETLLKSKYVNRADVSVVVREFAAKPISIVGAVRKTGSLNISGRWDLLQAIAAAGGLSETAGKKIYVLRHAENGLSDTLEISTEDLFRNAPQMWNIPIYPSDIVNIPPRQTVRIFCIGEVKSPGAVEFETDDRISLLSAIAKAGGLTDRASKKIRVKRRGRDGKDTEQTYDFKAILAGRSEDPTLLPDDVVIVKESFF
jgi:polysaccharide export outer membrane protein